MYTDNLKVSLDAAGLVALAELTTIGDRTALTGTGALLDTLVLCPSIQRQQAATELNGGEYPAVAALTSGYVFRVENPATVAYLQKISLTGHLTTLSVINVGKKQSVTAQLLSTFYTFENANLMSSISYLTAASLTIVVLVLFVISADWWGLFVIFLLMFARFCNTIIIRRRSRIGWKGASEPDVQGDLLILLSQDRWVRMRGAVDDLKTVTSGQWLHEMTFIEGSVAAFATLLVYLDAALASNLKQSGKVLLLVLLIVSAGLLAIANVRTDKLQMHGNIVKADGPRKKYGRRRDMADELIKETGRDDWAIRLGMIVPPLDKPVKSKLEVPATM